MSNSFRSACVLCMTSQASRQVMSIEFARKSAEKEAAKNFSHSFLVCQTVVDLDYSELSPVDKIVHDVVLEGFENDRYEALVLFGNQLTRFGEKVHLIARQKNLRIHIYGFGDGTFGRQYRAWYRKRPKKTTSKAMLFYK